VHPKLKKDAGCLDDYLDPIEGEHMYIKPHPWMQWCDDSELIRGWSIRQKGEQWPKEMVHIEDNVVTSEGYYLATTLPGYGTSSGECV
jgi:hypothetical protein